MQAKDKEDERGNQEKDGEFKEEEYEEGMDGEEDEFIKEKEDEEKNYEFIAEDRCGVQGVANRLRGVQIGL